MSRYLLAHDLGTSGNKATLFSLEGELIKSHTVPYETDYSHGNWAEQNPQDWWEAVTVSTRNLLSGVRAKDIVAVAFSGQMMGCLPVDRKGRPLRSHILYCDQRSTEESSDLENRIGKEALYRITGHRPSATYALEKLMWIRRNQPDIYRDTYKTLNAKDYINFRLTGRMVTDFNDASGTNAFDLGTMSWSDHIIDAAGVDREKLPEAVPSTTVIGEVTLEASAATGLKKGTPVVVGAGDGGCATVGIGSVRPGITYNYLGSSSWISTTSKEAIYDPEMRTFTWAHPVPGYLQPCGTMQTAGGALSWLKNELALSENREAEASGVSPYALIDAVSAESSPGAKGLLFLPYLLGERSPRWNPEAKGAFLGLTLEHKRSDLFRSVMEGVSLNLDIILRVLMASVDIREIRLIGGGARSRIWRQILADIFGIDILVPQYLEEATSMGAAIIGGVGCGVFKDFSVVDKFIEIKGRTAPRQETVSVYKRIKPVFDEAYQALENLFPKLHG